MSTTMGALVTRVRTNLLEPADRPGRKLWSDDDILAELNDGMWDLQKAIDALYQDYYFTTNSTDVTIVANATTVQGVPGDVMIVRGLEPRVPASYPFLEFQFKPYTSPAFMQARSLPAQDPTQLSIMLAAITGAAGPVGPPTIHIAPSPTSAVPLRLTYIPNLPAKTAEQANPIPGQSDKALICYATAYCRAKITEGNAPDPDWLALYATEKQNLIVALAPRQEQDDQVAEGLFEDLWN